MENTLDGRRNLASCLAEIINRDVENYKTDGIYDLQTILECAHNNEYKTFVLLTRENGTHLFDLIMDEATQSIFKILIEEAIGKYFVFIEPKSIKIQQYFKKGNTENE